MVSNAVLIGSDTLGSPDAKLGAILISSFLRLLGQRDEVPKYIILVNGGVKLAVKGAEAQEFLKVLEDRGTRIISCRTCVEYFGVEANIGVGEIDGMVRIQDVLTTHQVLTI